MDHHHTTPMGTMTMHMSPSSTMSSMAMGSMSGMPHSSHSSHELMGMDMMAMVFFTSPYTPLFSTAWTPETIGQYTGTCVFLIVFAAIFRALLALRSEFYPLLAALDARRDRGTGFDLYGSFKGAQRPWRARDAILLATLDMILAGVGYLLMLAVMTMNVGYFMSVLAGVFVGSIAFGRFTAGSTSC